MAILKYSTLLSTFYLQRESTHGVLASGMIFFFKGTYLAPLIFLFLFHFIVFYRASTFITPNTALSVED